MKFPNVFPVFVFTALLQSHTCQKDEDPCTDKEARQAACVHGDCYITTFHNFREPSCICYEEYAGRRCQELNLEMLSFDNVLSQYPSPSPSVYIIVGVVILVIVLAAIIFIVCYRSSYKT